MTDFWIIKTKVTKFMTADFFHTIIKTLPTNPGIYKYFDDQNELLYVGKAKDLEKGSVLILQKHLQI